MRKNLSDRVAALETSSKGEMIEVMPLAHFYGEDVEPERLPMKEWRRQAQHGLAAFYGEEVTE